jgi:hypothetical protein
VTLRSGEAGRRGSRADGPQVTIGQFWLDPKPFPRDPNAPPAPSDRSPRPLPAVGDQPARRQAQPRLIGALAGAELRRIVYGATRRPQLGH